MSKIDIELTSEDEVTEDEINDDEILDEINTLTIVMTEFT